MLSTEYSNNAKVYMQLANISDMKGERSKAALLYKKSLTLAPNDAVAHYNYSVFLERNGKVEEAIHHLKLAVRINNDWDMPKMALERLSGKRRTQESGRSD